VIIKLSIEENGKPLAAYEYRGDKAAEVKAMLRELVEKAPVSDMVWAPAWAEQFKSPIK
jgi:hypothetical protein